METLRLPSPQFFVLLHRLQKGVQAEGSTECLQCDPRVQFLLASLRFLSVFEQALDRSFNWCNSLLNYLIAVEDS